MNMKASTYPAALKPVQLSVTMDVIRAYGELSNDFNPIHVDPEFAATTPMGGVIAHGTLSLCLLWQAVQQSFAAEVFQDLDLDIRFVKPVRVGDVLTAGGERQPDGSYAVWVRGPAGDERIVGQIQLNAE